MSEKNQTAVVATESTKDQTELSQESAANKEQDAKLDAEQTARLEKIATAWKREESDRMEGYYSLAQMVSDYVQTDLERFGNTKKSFSASFKRVEACLADFTDDSKASVSRLLKSHGLYTLTAEYFRGEFGDEAEELCKENMLGLSTSLLKSLVRLIERDETAKGLVYVWNESAIAKGPMMVSDCYGDGWTVQQCSEAVDSLLTPAADDKEEEGTGSAKKVASQKATGKIANALTSAGKAGARKEALKRAVKTDALTTDDIITVVGASADARALIVATLTADEVMTTVRRWIETKKNSQVQALYLALREEIGKLKAAKEGAAAKEKELVAA